MSLSKRAKQRKLEKFQHALTWAKQQADTPDTMSPEERARIDAEIDAEATQAAMQAMREYEREKRRRERLGWVDDYDY